jgi:peptidoglycan/LPS O-acetylase OafA/YrhL
MRVYWSEDLNIQNEELSGHKATGKYRADIDGLRAIAVVLVVAYHAFPTKIQTGFIGVDIFFVISGFLITSIIFEEIRDANFSLKRFYVRRINRLFPALLLVMITCFAAGWFVLFPDEYKQLGKHTAAGAAFISNLVFWSEAGYFDSAADTKILLHLWSLGVEEQFYLVWPILIFFAWRGKFRVGSICILMLAASLYLNIRTVESHQVAAFFSPLTRFWELLSGGMLAILVTQKTSLQNWEENISRRFDAVVYQSGHATERSSFRDVAAVLGAASIVAAVTLMPAGANFPGKWALLPVVGTLLLIFSGPSTWMARTILSKRPVVFIGLISYPLYLWHWPLLAFTRHMLEQAPSDFVLGGIVLGSVALAWLTYVLVEKPIRFGTKRTRSAAVLLLLMACVGIFGLYDATHEGIRSRMNDRNEYAKYFEGQSSDGDQLGAEREDSAQNRCNRYFYFRAWGDVRPRQSIDPECYTKKTAKSVLIWGDSHAAHLFYGIKKSLPQDISTLLIFSSGCGPRPINMARLELDHCEKSNYSALNLVETHPPDVVVLASSTSFDIEYIRDLTVKLKKLGVKKVLVMGSLPRWKPSLYKTVMKYYWLKTPNRIVGHQDTDKLNPDLMFRAQIKSNDEFEYVNLFDFFCNADGCMTYLGDNRREGLITFDDAHLRPFASIYLAEKLLDPLILKGIDNGAN